MNNHYARYQNDVNNTASSLVTQMVCAEKGLDYNQVLHLAQQAHLNGIFQQEQMRQFNQVLNRHYGGNTFFGKVKEVFGGGGGSFFPMTGMPSMPMAPTPAFLPQVSGPMSPQQAAGLLSSPTQAPVGVGTQQLQKDVEDLKQALTGLMQALQPPSVPPQQPAQPAQQLWP